MKFKVGTMLMVLVRILLVSMKSSSTCLARLRKTKGYMKLPIKYFIP